MLGRGTWFQMQGMYSMKKQHLKKSMKEIQE